MTPVKPQSNRRSFAAETQIPAYDHEVLEISRVVRVVKGGRRFRFRAAVIVGDRRGSVGLGIGKSRDIQQAIQKAQDAASKNTTQVDIQNGTIPHTIMTKHKGAQIMLKPARPGTGIIAGSTIRTVADLAGIRDLVAKRFGSTNKISNAEAALKALALVSRRGLAERPVGQMKIESSKSNVKG